MSLSTAEYQALDHAHFLHPFTDHKRMHETGARIIQRAEGVYLWDSDGHQMLDAMAGLGGGAHDRDIQRIGRIQRGQLASGGFQASANARFR